MWKGRAIEDLSKDELLDVVDFLAGQDPRYSETAEQRAARIEEEVEAEVAEKIREWSKRPRTGVRIMYDGGYMIPRRHRRRLVREIISMREKRKT